MLLPHSKTKIIATVGPACQDEATLATLIDEGVNVFRLNFSHGSLSEHEPVVEAIRTVSAKRNAVVAIMGDLCGPKIRVGDVADDSFRYHRGRYDRDRARQFPLHRRADLHELRSTVQRCPTGRSNPR